MRKHRLSLPLGRAPSRTAPKQHARFAWLLAVLFATACVDQLPWEAELRSSSLSQNNSGDFTISELRAASGRTYQVVYHGLRVNAVQFTDRRYPFVVLPAGLEGLTYIQTANDDKTSSAGSGEFLSFTISGAALVYVAHDNRRSRPAWLSSSFADTGMELTTDEKGVRRQFRVFMRHFPAGTVVLGSNSDTGIGKGSMYSVVISPVRASTWIYPGEDIQRKVDEHPPGTSFLIKAGVHRMQQITPKDGQQFVGEPGAVLSGARLLTQFSRDGSLWVASAQQVDKPKHGKCKSAYPLCRQVEDLFLDDVRLQPVASLTEVTRGRWYFDRAAGKVYLADRPARRTVELGATKHAFTGSARSVVIRGLTIEKYASRAQNGAVHGNGSDGWVVENNVIRWNHGVGIRIGQRMQVRGNQVLANGQLGIGGIGDNVLVQNNVISRNNTAGYSTGWEAGGTKFVRTLHLVVRGNRVQGNAGPGLWTDIDNLHTVYENNLVEDNDEQGIFHEISYDAVIRYNTVRRNGFVRASSWLYGAGILVAHSPNVEVYGNVVEDNWNGIAGIQQRRGNGRYGPYKLRNLHAHNNVVRMHRGVTGVARDDGDPDVFSKAGNNRFESNTYSVDGADKRRWAWAGSNRRWSDWQSYRHDRNGVLNSH